MQKKGAVTRWMMSSNFRHENLNLPWWPCLEEKKKQKKSNWDGPDSFRDLLAANRAQLHPVRADEAAAMVTARHYGAIHVTVEADLSGGRRGAREGGIKDEVK